jgi:hypothetical protein
MKIINQYPPNFEIINQAFKLHKGIVFTYGDIIYNPDNGPIDEPLMNHEKTHSQQQAEYGVEKWWDRYLADPAFRASQEIPAYQNQYKLACKLIKDKNRLFNYTSALAKDLSGEMYGKLMTFDQALEAIKNPVLYKFKI